MTEITSRNKKKYPVLEVINLLIYNCSVIHDGEKKWDESGGYTKILLLGILIFRKFNFIFLLIVPFVTCTFQLQSDKNCQRSTTLMTYLMPFSKNFNLLI